MVHDAGDYYLVMELFKGEIPPSSLRELGAEERAWSVAPGSMGRPEIGFRLCV